MSSFDQWLDRLARALATPDLPPAPAPSRPPTSADPAAVSREGLLRLAAEQLPEPSIPAPLARSGLEQRKLSRSAALKALVAAAVFVGLPAARTTRAAAEDSGDCAGKCSDDYTGALLHRTRLCNHLYSKYDPGNSIDLLFRTPLVGSVYGGFCQAWVARSVDTEFFRCLDSCKQSDKPTAPKPLCEGGEKSAPSARAKSCASFPPPAPTLAPPAPPPPPPPPSDACANCQSVGGTCCGSNADGSLCACGCSSCNCCTVYGCCS